jgi:hypothetical protein
MHRESRYSIIMIVIYSFGMSHEFRILIKPHGISQEMYQSSRGKLKTHKFLCVHRDAHFLKSCILSKYCAYITQDACQNESLLHVFFTDTLVFTVTFLVFTVIVQCLRVFHGPELDLQSEESRI